MFCDLMLQRERKYFGSEESQKLPGKPAFSVWNVEDEPCRQAQVCWVGGGEYLLGPIP